MTNSLLLDEMFSDAIAARLRAKNHDVCSAVADQSLAGLPDDQLLEHAVASGRALVTANIKDFLPLDSRYRVTGRSHAGLILVSTKTFPQNRAFSSAIADALLALLDADAAGGRGSAGLGAGGPDAAGPGVGGLGVGGLGAGGLGAVGSGQVMFLARS
jgi:hypothetical protein